MALMGSSDLLSLSICLTWAPSPACHLVAMQLTTVARGLTTVANLNDPYSDHYGSLFDHPGAEHWAPGALLGLRTDAY